VHLRESVVENSSSVWHMRLCVGTEPTISPIAVRAQAVGGLFIWSRDSGASCEQRVFDTTDVPLSVIKV
jgi:hypothetical protein